MADQVTSAERGLDRLVFFSDAVVAIAITLLILPVVDSVSETVPDQSARDVLGDNGNRLLAFVLSFAVIARLWVVHHDVFGKVRGYSSALLWANLLWLLTIVFLPMPTELLGVRGDDEASVRFIYIASVLASSAALALTEWVIARSPDLRAADRPAEPIGRVLVTPGLLLLALVVNVAVPWIGLWSLLLLFLSGTIERRVAPRSPDRP